MVPLAAVWAAGAGPAAYAGPAAEDRAAPSARAAAIAAARLEKSAEEMVSLS